jgi:hypothetical protein
VQSVFLLRFDKNTDGGPVDTLIAFVGAGEFRPGKLASSIARETEVALAPDQLIILSRDDQTAAVAEAVGSSRELRSTMARLHRSTVRLLAYDARGQMTDERVLTEGSRAADVDLGEILRRGATRIFKSRGGFVEPNASYHFANPSGRHTDRFMRLSNILVRNVEIAFLAVAIMPLIPAEAARAYIDTPSLYAVTSAINEQWRTLAPDRPALQTDNFRSYEGFAEYQFEDIERSVVLISASSSGGLADKLVQKGIGREAIVHVLYLGKTNPDLRIAVDLLADEECNPEGYAGDREIYEADNCRMCARGSKFVPLLGDQFDIRGPQPEPLVMRKTYAPKGLDQAMGRLAGTGALAVSTGDRQFLVDAPALMAAERFLVRMDFMIRSHVPGGVRAIVVANEDSIPFAKRVVSISGGSGAIIGRAEIDRVIGADPDNPAPVLVCAAAVGGGRVLLEISRDLRRACRRAPIIYLVGVSKPTSATRRETLARNLVQSHHPVPHAFHAVEELVLPGPPTPNPWQEELAFLENTADLWPEEVRPLLETRRARLLKASEPLLYELFVANAPDRELRLQPNFAFWRTLYANSQADVFVTMAAVMQRLREDPVGPNQEALRTNWLQQTLLSPENFGRFNDGVIQAAILRGARPAELDYRDDPSISSDAARIIRRILEASAHARGEAAAEFLLALGTGRLRVRDADAAQVLQPLDGAPPLVETLRCLVREGLLTRAASPAICA